MENIKKIVNSYWLFLLFILFFISAILTHFFAPHLKDFLIFMTGLATILLAILTGIYVFTTNKQLEIMKRQLNEMEYSRNLQTQPLPVLQSVECYMETPRVFIDVPEDRKIEVLNNIFLKANIENIGIGSAVSIDIVTELICNYPNKKRHETVSTRLDFLKESDHSKYEELFRIDEGILENCLKDSIKQLPFYEIHIYYKNVLGGYFKANYKYKIYPFDEDKEVIKNWLKNIKMFDIDFLDSIEKYNSNLKTNPDNAVIIFDEIKSKFEKNVQVSKIELPLDLIPGSFFVKPISEEEFNSEVEKKPIRYGTRLGFKK